MIRGIIKLGTLALAGYAAYSLYQIFSGQDETLASLQGGGGRRVGRPIEDFGTEIGGTRMTGGGTGQPEVTNDPAGTMASHRVGRGVIQR